MEMSVLLGGQRNTHSRGDAFDIAFSVTYTCFWGLESSLNCDRIIFIISSEDKSGKIFKFHRAKFSLKWYLIFQDICLDF